MACRGGSSIRETTLGFGIYRFRGAGKFEGENCGSGTNSLTCGRNSVKYNGFMKNGICESQLSVCSLPVNYVS